MRKTLLSTWSTLLCTCIYSVTLTMVYVGAIIGLCILIIVLAQASIFVTLHVTTAWTAWCNLVIFILMSASFRSSCNMLCASAIELFNMNQIYFVDLLNSSQAAYYVQSCGMCILHV